VVAAAPEPPPPPIPAPAYDGGAAERIRIQEETIRRQEELARRLREELAQRDSLAASPLPSPTTLGGETAAARLADELKSQNLRAASILVEGSRVSLIVSDCFESGSDRLKPNPDVKAAITAAASAIVKNPGAKVDVVGHTDGQPLQRTLGKWGSNVELSKARARSVATALAGSGVPDERLRVDGRGEFEPLIAPEKSKSDRAKNRRVEVQISL
jgi:flagellar motor protein MotB